MEIGRNNNKSQLTTINLNVIGDLGFVRRNDENDCLGHPI